MATKVHPALAAIAKSGAAEGASRLKIGISACFMPADPPRTLFTGKTLQYVEQSIAHWVMSTGALAVMIPSDKIRDDQARPYLAAVQWHPEFHQSDCDTIDDAARATRGEPTS